jgi:hypothetical protein
LEDTYPAIARLTQVVAVPFKDTPDIPLLVQYADDAESAGGREVIDADIIESGHGP